MNTFEHIINLCSGGGPGSSTIEQHLSAMRMDARYTITHNLLTYAIRQTRVLT